MHNYKALKSAGSVSVQKVKVVDYPEVFATAEIKYKDGDELPEGKEIGDIKVGEVFAGAEQSHDELKVICKKFDSNTGEAQDDSVTVYSLSDVKGDIDSLKSQIAELETQQADLEQLETDLKVL